LILKIKLRKRKNIKRIKDVIINSKLQKILRTFLKEIKNKKRKNRHLLNRVNIKREVLLKILKDKLQSPRFKKAKRNQS
jgi:hypothetical protein